MSMQFEKKKQWYKINFIILQSFLDLLLLFSIYFFNFHRENMKMSKCFLNMKNNLLKDTRIEVDLNGKGIPTSVR